ncbi:MAG TPA: GMC family oxidoreductase [Capillimicrobium sp.]|nr:GMC family oxidoreductase [Capillimicrobium sp.]
MRTLRADVAVVGTGAGGAVVAKELAEAGVRVVLVEEGRAHPPETLTARPRDMLVELYRDAGQTVTIGSPPIVLPLGKAVGGTTLVNSGTCFRTPGHVLDRWRAEDGLDLDLDFDRVEAELNVAEVPAELAGRNAELVRRGAAALGLSGGYLRRNVRGCVGSGVCAYGCPAGAKQHVGATYVPKAVAAGAELLTGVRIRRIRTGRDGAVTGVEGDGVRVEAPRVVLAAGAIHTPALLAANRLGRSPALGRNLSIHPATAARARFDEDVVLWDGVPQSYHVDALAGDGIMLEGIAGPPDYLAMAIPRHGREHRELMLDARRLAQFGVMVSDTARGRVRSVRGRPIVRYDLAPADAARFQRGLELLARIWFAAGAREVVVPVAGVPPLRDGDTGPLRAARVRPADLTLMAFHPLGTARASADPARGVLDPDLQVRGTPGLYVGDGAAVPSSLGVNPQITIMALATRLAGHIACRV